MSYHSMLTRMAEVEKMDYTNWYGRYISTGHFIYSREDYKFVYQLVTQFAISY